ncbi:uncharacterized protein LOC108023756 isoform X2 [Drosophila biarmipes]|uniref:uncharacterized protein LOC108023756 isoform X2 n=1 Tax=Drosophila biarmipes TaxID=125945 RepID=UPI0021CC64AC|nr:uncharacterized protein LOC108023756 isoform X2 [Drosophila biarmipes]
MIRLVVLDASLRAQSYLGRRIAEASIVFNELGALAQKAHSVQASSWRKYPRIFGCAPFSGGRQFVPSQADCRGPERNEWKLKRETTNTHM